MTTDASGTVTPQVDWSVAWHMTRHGYGELARYASTESLTEVGLAQHNHGDLLLAGQIDDISSDLFRQLVDRRWGYNLEPWSVDNAQLIRDAVAINRGSGTCLDLALLTCAMAKSAGLRPYLAIARAPRHHSGTRRAYDHAFVIIDRGATARQLDARALWDSVDPEWREDHLQGNRQPFWVTLDLDGESLDVPATWLPFDPTEACRSTATHPRTHVFADAQAAANAYLTADNGYERLVLVDVVGAHAAGYDELPPRTDDTRPALFQYVPAITGYVDIPSRRDLIEDLSTANGYLVLTGPPGSGKSVTAALVAIGAAAGAGWVLNAEDNATLVADLAQAAASHLGIDPEGLDGKDVVALATAGLGILNRANARWVVVIDNANHDPADYGNLPVPGPQQLVVITTTNESAWAAWAASSRGDRQVVALPAVTAEERNAWLAPGEAISDLPDTPLLLNMAVRLSRAELLPPGRAVEDLAGAAVADLSEAQAEVARALTWLPPVPIDPADLGPVAAAVDRLAALGLVESTAGGRVLMHRSVRTAVATMLHHPDRDPDVLLGLLRNPATAGYVEVAATVADLGLIASTVDSGRLDDRAVAECMYVLGTFQARKDSEASATWFQRVLDLSGAPEDVMDPQAARLVCGALQGTARAALRGGDVPARQRALASLDPVEGLAARFPDDGDLQVAASRAEAMVGLLRSRLASPDRIPDDAARLAERLEALALIEHSAQRRAELVSPDSPDIDRSLFNIPGALVGIAQAEADPAEAEAHLRRAVQIYQDVYRVRADRYRTDELEEVIACRNGMAIASYYLAVLSPTATVSERFSLLTQAHADATYAADVRQRLSSGPVSTDSLKSTAVAAKTQLMVLQLAELIGRAPADAAHGKVLTDFGREAAWLAAAMPPEADGS